MNARVRGGTRRSGFTLIELMVVMLLVGILTALIIPEMRGTYQEALLRTTGRQLVGVFDLAASRAVSYQRIYRVRFDAATGRYGVEQRGRDGTFVPAPDFPGGQGRIDRRLALEIRQPNEEALEDSDRAATASSPTGQPLPAGNQAIAFYADGTADGAEILLRDRAGEGLALRINPITARVRIREQKLP